MNNKTMTAIGIGACATACAASFLIPTVLGAGALGLGGLAVLTAGLNEEVIVCVVAALGLAGGATWFYHNRTAKRASCAADGSCGCAPAKVDTLKRT